MRNSRKLLLKWLNMVRVDMSITESVDELSALEATDLSQHACEQGIAGDVKGHAEAEITRTLIHLAGELVVS